MDEVPTVFTVANVKAETEQMRLLSLKTEKMWSFIPGHVAILGIEGIGESYFAIASSPEDRNAMEFLVKDGKGASAALFRVTDGAKVQGKGPVGKGFPVDNYPGRDFFIAAVGSAISPMRGVIRHIITKRESFGKVSFIYGVRFPGEFPFLSEMKNWEKAGINITLAVSRPEGTNWEGKTGRINLYYAEALQQLNKPVALICGMKAMQDESREELVKLGIAAHEILTNY